MFTSRSEYRLLLRCDNADLRLTEKGYRAGLVTESRYQAFLRKRTMIQNELERLMGIRIAPDHPVLIEMMASSGAALKRHVTLTELLKMPQASYKTLHLLDQNHPDVSAEVAEQIEIHIKYEGYISKQMEMVARASKWEKTRIPEDLDFLPLKGLTIEARQKLSRIRPVSNGQASRVAGVTPSDISALVIHLETYRRRLVNR